MQPETAESVGSSATPPPGPNCYFTRSGRLVKAPVRFEHTSEVTDDYNSDEHDDDDDEDDTDVTSIETSSGEEDDEGSDLESFISDDETVEADESDEFI